MSSKPNENLFEPVVDASLNTAVLYPQSYERPRVKKVKKLTIVLIVLIATIIFVGPYFIANPYRAYFYMDFYPRGNTYANLSSGGFAAESKGWIYLSDAPGGKNGLYKINFKTKETALLSAADTGAVRSINVSGGWVYYVSGEGAEAALYKVSTDGGDSVLIQEGCTQAILFGDWFYCMGNGHEIYKIKTDGSSKKIIAFEVTSLLFIRRNNICAMAEKDGILSAVRILPNDGKSIIMTNLSEAVSDGYFVYATEKNNDELYTLIHRENVPYGNFSMIPGMLFSKPFVTDEWLFANRTDGIWRMNKDGSEAAKISNDRYTVINSAGDWLVYRSESSGTLMKMKADGSEASPFWEGISLAAE